MGWLSKAAFASRPAAFRRAKELADHEAKDQVVWHEDEPTRRWRWTPGATHAAEERFDKTGPSWTWEWTAVPTEGRQR